jgi:hypothetical protein
MKDTNNLNYFDNILVSRMFLVIQNLRLFIALLTEGGEFSLYENDLPKIKIINH